MISEQKSRKNIADDDIEITGFGASSKFNISDVSAEVVNYGTRSDGDDGITVAFNMSQGTLTKIENTKEGDLIQISNATASVAFDDSYIQTGSGSFQYEKDSDGNEYLRLVQDNDKSM